MSFFLNCLIPLPGWLPWLIIYSIWLVAKKPFKRFKVYDFRLSGFTIRLDTWHVGLPVNS